MENRPLASRVWASLRARFAAVGFNITDPPLAHVGMREVLTRNRLFLGSGIGLRLQGFDYSTPIAASQRLRPSESRNLRL